MAVYVVGVVGIVVFYLMVLAVGIWASKKQKNHGEEEVLLAGRSLGLVVGVLTLIATWVGGGYINGTAEAMFTSGLAWCQVPIGYSLSLLFGVLLFVRPMRENNYVTMLDPFQNKYGERVGGLLYLPALCGDLFWVGAILNALGSSLVVILELDNVTSVIVSTLFAAAYTMVGGLYSVTYTDVLQLVCIVFGLILSAPFAYHHPAVNTELMASSDWLGHLGSEDIGEWIDMLLLLTFGGIPWQGYFQRILSIKSTTIAQVLSIASLFGCIAMAVPAALFGVIARGTDWINVENFNRNVTKADGEIILPLTLRYLTPAWVSFFGLGAISAAVMSSADSSILASSSMFSRNIYKLAIRPKASEREVLWVLRIAVLVIATLSAVIALTVGSVYYLSYLCSDLVYVILFPQLLLVIHWPDGVNTYGCLASYGVGLLLRILGGEKGLGIPVTIKFPYFNAETETQKFPFRTFAMVIAIITHMAVSTITRLLFEREILSAKRWDILGVFTPPDKPRATMPTLSESVAMHLANGDSLPIVETDNQSIDKGVVNPVIADQLENNKDSRF